MSHPKNDKDSFCAKHIMYVEYSRKKTQNTNVTILCLSIHFGPSNSIALMGPLSPEVNYHPRQGLMALSQGPCLCITVSFHQRQHLTSSWADGFPRQIVIRRSASQPLHNNIRTVSDYTRAEIRLLKCSNNAFSSNAIQSPPNITPVSDASQSQSPARLSRAARAQDVIMHVRQRCDGSYRRAPYNFDFNDACGMLRGKLIRKQNYHRSSYESIKIINFI